MNWKDIPNYEGLYQVSDCGHVKSLERFRAAKNGSLANVKERILKPRLDKYGYHKVSLCKDGKAKNFLVHRLVALAFLDGDNTLTVNHIDECKTNNHVSNLEYLTQGDNARAWIKNNPDIQADSLKKAREASGCVAQQIIDTQTGRVFPSIKAVSRYMHDEEGAKGLQTWFHKIKVGKQDRFKFIIN